METTQLRYFVEVARQLNFTHAAQTLGVTQPALSRSIGKLEDELGQPVFERQGRSLSQTDSGELLQTRAMQILRMIDDTKAEINDDGKSGRIRITAIPTIAPYFLPGLLQEFTRQFPLAQVIVQEDVTERALQKCNQGEVDLAILVLPITARYLEIENLFEEELFLVLPNDHALLAKKRITVTDVESYPFVLLDEAHCLSDNIVTFCRNRRVQPVAVERTSQLATVQELVSLGHGVSMVPAMARRRDETNRREYRSLAGKKPTRTIAMCFNSYRFQSQLLEAFKKCLRQYCRQFG